MFFSYKQFLLENEEESTRHVVGEDDLLDSRVIVWDAFRVPGDIYYINKKQQLHRLNGPAFIRVNGDQDWYKDGELHREGGPAHTTLDGHKAWWRYGERHREDGPAIINSMGIKFWYINDIPIADDWQEGNPKFHSERSFNKEKWLLLKGSIENNFEILNAIGMDTAEQEYVIKERPDLIDKIKGLKPWLRIKYSQELSLSGIEV